ncbi:hypothetical protein RHGRI_036087 [Rhododendron griersonianum]|uniref:Inositol-pentakisphosphate 2-kinase n=1 Tax=Rhododendron griersonianum TaxID=479676 RepID=A0AAV6HPM3_9ERIC|nr:hypothetical protein RHGRI_036087 [Rhododendron griersonianum]
MKFVSRIIHAFAVIHKLLHSTAFERMSRQQISNPSPTQAGQAQEARFITHPSLKAQNAATNRPACTPITPLSKILRPGAEYCGHDLDNRPYTNHAFNFGWMEVVLERKDADDWIYRGEGATNLVLDYSGSSPTFV